MSDDQNKKALEKVSKSRWMKAIFSLPFPVLVFIPFLILYFTDYRFALNAPSWPAIILGSLFLCLGLFFAFWTMYLFHIQGRGTAAPWDPPKNLVIEGPYKYVRNPMLLSVFIMLISESLLLGSLGIFIFFIIFLVGNMFYFPYVEEKGLRKRFGDDYQRYCKHVPRFFPRFSPWDLHSSSNSKK